jgi:hypothetical protein
MFKGEVDNWSFTSGVLYFKDGSKYTGKFSNLLMHDQNGELMMGREPKVYKGEFENGKMHGSGVIIEKGVER